MPKRFSTFVLFLVLAMVCFCGLALAADETVEVSSEEILDVYLGNELAGDHQFKGKKVKVSGTIRDISKSPTGHYYVNLKSNDMMRSVQCFFPENQLDGLLKLKKNEPLTTTCDVRGMGMLNLELINCSLPE